MRYVIESWVSATLLAFIPHFIMITTTVRSLRPLGRLNLRGTTVSSARFNSSLPAGASKDNEHPHLYYHLQPPPPAAPRRIALSFLPQPPAVADSKTVLGYLPAVQGVGLNNFSENKEFIKLLHESIKGAIENGEAQSVEYLAHTRPGDGYLTLTGKCTWSCSSAAAALRGGPLAENKG